MKTKIKHELLKTYNRLNSINFINCEITSGELKTLIFVKEELEKLINLV